MRTIAALVTLLALIAAANVASAAQPDAGSAPSAENGAAEQIDPKSPQAALKAFLKLARDERHEEAAAYLQVPRSQAARKAELAERLRFVLERHDGADPSELSPRAEGDTDDGLPQGVDRVTVVASPDGEPEDLLIKRVSFPEGKRWVFPRETVIRVDRWFGELEERWLLEKLPEPLLRTGPFNLLWWQLLALMFVSIVAWIVGTILGKVTVGLLHAFVSRIPPNWAEEVVRRKRGPVTLLWFAATSWALLPVLDLYPAAEDTLRSVLRLTVYIALFWAFSRALDVLAVNLASSAWGRRSSGARTLIPLASRLLKALVLGLAVVGLLAQLGYPVASLVAGLGIGGLALALAAQKTIENLFGALALAVDQPLREGDLVKIGEYTGTVEAIGLRSTRLRALDRTLISIPNGGLAEMKIESLAARDRRLFECKIGLVYTTRPDQLRRVLRDLEGILRGHDKVWPEPIEVHLAAFGASSLDIEVTAWFATTHNSEFLALRQEILLRFMDAVHAAGTTFAYPTQTLHLSAEPERSAES